jgi:hypothetical protein
MIVIPNRYKNKKFFHVLWRIIQDHFYNLKEFNELRLDTFYCSRCGACGQEGCCHPKLCDNGFGCAHFYDHLTEEEKNEDW